MRGESGPPLPGRTLRLPPPAEALMEVWEEVWSKIPEPTQSTRWALGGGTILAARWDHRRSYDIDVFFGEEDWTGGLREAGVCDRLRHLAHGRGYDDSRTRERVLTISPVIVDGRRLKIDVVGMEPRIPITPSRDRVEGRGKREAMDTWAILAGKLAGRGKQARDRDLYDLAVGMKHEPEETRRAMGILTAMELEEQQVAVEERRGTPLRPKAVQEPTDEDVMRHGVERVIELYAETRMALEQGVEEGWEGERWRR